MLVECIRTFLDTATGQTRKAGDRFEVDSERFSAINGTKYGQLVKEVEEAVSERPKTRRRTAKRAAKE